VVTENGREAQWVQRLSDNPPDWVATVPRDLSEYGIKRYGERPGAGKDLLDWLGANYVEAISRRPVEVKPGHVQLFQRRSEITTAPDGR
jgi:hypothetical protein